jgi:hypothetical protein
MKHSLLRLSILALLLAIKTTVFAGVGDSFEVDGIAYRITSSSTVEVRPKSSGKYAGDVVIPDNVVYNGKTYSVTSIVCAFEKCSDLTSVSIGKNVTVIDGWAFTGCSRLSSIILPDDVTYIGYDAFKDCSGLTSFTIPNKVTTIMGGGI